ncbi:50S ribosomal protein L19 [Candidatus Microgenomates bacterium]|nr:50S ribosomal protein L19 [Candidatus Microgenomates bacterium]
MALKATIKETTFGVGDTVRVIQRIKEDADKERLQAFEGMVIGIKGRGNEKTFTVRRIGAQRVGIERIFPVSSPAISAIEMVRDGTSGIRHAKLYYTRTKPKKEIETIYSRANKKARTSI